jgi:hypothetical protein
MSAPGTSSVSGGPADKMAETRFWFRAFVPPPQRHEAMGTVKGLLTAGPKGYLCKQRPIAGSDTAAPDR